MLNELYRKYASFCNVKVNSRWVKFRLALVDAAEADALDVLEEVDADWEYDRLSQRYMSFHGSRYL